MNILVCGSRTFSDTIGMWDTLNGIYEEHATGYMVSHIQPLVVIEGGADGADKMARNWAKSSPFHPYQDTPWDSMNPPEVCPVMLATFPAEWKKYGRGAGPIRNQQMLDLGKPDEVWGFIDKPLKESRGTADMIRRARARSIMTRVLWVPAVLEAPGPPEDLERRT